MTLEVIKSEPIFPGRGAGRRPSRFPIVALTVELRIAAGFNFHSGDRQFLFRARGDIDRVARPPPESFGSNFTWPEASEVKPIHGDSDAQQVFMAQQHCASPEKGDGERCEFMVGISLET